MEGAIKVVSHFINRQLKEFYHSAPFQAKLNEFENTVNEKFAKFLGTVDKKIVLRVSEFGNTDFYLSLTDRGNVIPSENISTGEAILFNLVISLTGAREEKCDILCIDEPDVHMHDDMIQVLADELLSLSQIQKECIIVLASHSTSLIEKLVTSSRVHLISIDSNRMVRNSEKDVELIKALQRNGVKFSPLMLSRNLNIFIENLSGSGRNHKLFFQKFLQSDVVPNVIPIGTSGNVNDRKSFVSVLEDIVKVSDVASVGIQDGDIWFKAQLTQYLQHSISLEVFLERLKTETSMYINNTSHPGVVYFNFWEIENLYLMDEILHCWSLKNGDLLNSEIYTQILFDHKSILVEQYLSMFLKSVVHIRPDTRSVGNTKEILSAKLELLGELDGGRNEIDENLQKLSAGILKDGLVNWVPGKEIFNLLKSLSYKFDDSGFDFKNSKTSRGLSHILTKS
jgi:hypothetical protein